MGCKLLGNLFDEYLASQTCFTETLSKAFTVFGKVDGQGIQCGDIQYSWFVKYGHLCVNIFTMQSEFIFHG